MSLKIRPFLEDDIAFAVAQTAREGWENAPAGKIQEAGGNEGRGSAGVSEARKTFW